MLSLARPDAQPGTTPKDTSARIPHTYKCSEPDNLKATTIYVSLYPNPLNPEQPCTLEGSPRPDRRLQRIARCLEIEAEPRKCFDAGPEELGWVCVCVCVVCV